jgi:hypothetical protein
MDDFLPFTNIAEITSADLEGFRDTWSDGPPAKKKKQERLMVVEIAELWAVSEAHDLAADPNFVGGFRYRKQGAGSSPLMDRSGANLTGAGFRQRHNICGSLASRRTFRQRSLVHDQPVQDELLHDLLELVEIHWLLDIAVDM